MKIGIIVYSQTGHTLSVAEKIREKFTLMGHEAVVEEIRVEGQGNANTSPNSNPALVGIPNPEGYEGLVFGSPVHGFSLSIPMVKYLSQLPSLEGKKIGCFVTQHLKYNWMGGSRSVRQIKKACEGKKGRVPLSGIVHWNSPERDRQIEELIDTLGKI